MLRRSFLKMFGAASVALAVGAYHFKRDPLPAEPEAFDLPVFTQWNDEPGMWHVARVDFATRTVTYEPVEC
jgi:hypothetical protein